MTPPGTLPAQLYLLACDPGRQRLSGRSQLGYVLRAAVLAELQLRGLLTDRGGKPVVTTGPAAAGLDPLHQRVLAELANSKPRRWTHWVSKNATSTRRAVEDALVSAGALRITRARRLGLLPVSRISLTDPRVRTGIETVLRETVLGCEPVARVAPKAAALVALAAAGDLRTALPHSMRRACKQRIKDLSTAAGAPAAALRHALAEIANSGGYVAAAGPF
jgi:hypothetical protein